MRMAIELADDKAKQIVADLLCSAFEGGSNYWYRIDGYVWPDGKTRGDLEAEKARKNTDPVDKTFYPHIDLPLMGGGIKVRDMEGEKGVVVLTWKKCARALALMAQPGAACGAHHWKNIVSEDTDAETGDVFLQMALWGEVVYG